MRPSSRRTRSPSGSARARTTVAPCAGGLRARAPGRRAGRAARRPPARAGRTRARSGRSWGTARRPRPARAARGGCPARPSSPRSAPPSRPRGGRTRRARTRSAAPRRTRPRARATACGRGARTPCSPASGPWPQRISRDSPPDVARGSPGSNWSTSVTSAPSRASHQASDAPNVPAPTITTLRIARRVDGAGRTPDPTGPLWDGTRGATTQRVLTTCADMRAVLAAVLLVLLAPAAARRRAVRASVEGRALERRARRRSGRAGARARRRLDPRQRDRRARGRAAAAARSRRRAGVQLWLVERANPDGVRRGHAPERPRRRPQPQLPVPLGRRRAAVRHLLPRPARRVGAGDARAAGADRRGPARRSRSTTTSTCGSWSCRARADRAPVRDYARRVGLPARWLPPLPRHRDRLAEPPLPRHDRVRRRAARRAAAQPRARATPRARGARRRRPAAPRAAAARAQAADRVGPDPVRRRPQAPDARVLAPPLRRRPRPSSSTRR